MKNHVKINRNKQKQLNKRKKVDSENNIYKSPDSYKVFTIIHMSKTPLEVQINTPYNHILYDCSGMSELETSYLIRSSDLLILAVGCGDVDRNAVEMIKRCMPSTLVVYGRKYKGAANGLAKIFGGLKICEASMLKHLLETFETKNTQLCVNRPFIVARDYAFEGDYLYVRGFMKRGLRSSRVIVNGVHEGIVEEVVCDGNIIKGEELNGQEYEKLDNVFEKGSECTKVEENDSETNKNCQKFDNNGNHVYQESDDNSDQDIVRHKDQKSTNNIDLEGSDSSSYDDGNYSEFDDEEEYLGDEYDLINKYKDYCGIMNPATCTFSDQEKPEYYRDLIFMKNEKYAQNLLATKTGRLPKNSVVELKIRVSQKFEARFIVIFGLFEFEEKNTIWNYQFSGERPLAKTVVVDNGYRIYETQTMLTCNLAHNLFQEEPEITHGVVSFIGPFSYYASGVNVISEGETRRLMNGESKDRIFFKCVNLKGRPVKIYKRYCVIKGMFYNKRQVEYFNNIKIETKSGDRGFIKKALGTKGLFKAYFSRPVKHNDIIKMSLYKRIFL